MADILENPVDLIDDAYEQEIQVEQEMIEVVAYRSYNQLDDKPQINGVELVGNKTSSDLGITAQIESAVNSEAQARTQADNTLQGKIDTEKLARQQADSTLQGNIDAEETARKAADKDIQDVLDGETLARQNADTALGGRIDTEIHNRQVADIGLQGQIDAITSKSDVVDVVATYADLQAYDTQHLGDNDVIKVLDDETHGDALTYYRWSKTNQTWTFIGQEAPYYSKSQTDTLLLVKQNTIDSSHKLSADLVDDTSTTNKFVTAEDKTTWNAKQNALTAGQGIDITSDVISTPAIVPEVAASLPAEGTEGKLYLTPKAHTTSTATGNPVTASVTEQAGALESFQLDGDTFQQSYTGKNLSPNVGAYDYKVNQDATISRKTDSSITFVSSVNSNSGILMHKNTQSEVCPEMFEEGYVFSCTAVADRAIKIRFGTSGHFAEADIGTEPIRISTQLFSNNWICYDASSNGTVTVTISDFQVEAGSTATSYEPYVGGTPSPNPDYPQQIQTVTGEQTVEIVGKNLFRAIDGQYRYSTLTVDVENGVIHVYGCQHATYDQNIWIPVEDIHADGTYTLTMNYSGSGGGALRLTKDKSYQAANNFGGTYYAPNRDTSVTASATNITYNWILIYLGHSSSPIEVDYYINPQFESGSISTSFSPYSKHTYPINLGTIELCKLGDYQDYIYKDGDDWKVHKATGEVTLNGSETWIMATTNVWGSYSWANTTALTNFKPWGVSKSALFKDAELNAGSVIQDNYMQVASGGIVIRHTGSTTATAFETWLESAKPMIRYQLATATDTTITDTTLIAQLEAIRTASLENGTNTITNSTPAPNLAGDMEIGYYGYNPTNRYDKFIWLDLNNAYEQLNNPDTSSTLSTLSTRSLGTTTEQPTVTRSLETETITLKKGETEPIEEETELPTTLDEETETTEPEESDGTDER